MFKPMALTVIHYFLKRKISEKYNYAIRFLKRLYEPKPSPRPAPAIAFRRWRGRFVRPVVAHPREAWRGIHPAARRRFVRNAHDPR